MGVQPGRVLLVDNSRAYAGMVSCAIAERLGLEVAVADSLAAAEKAMDQWGDEILVVLSGLVLPDAKESEVVGRFVARSMPLVVVTGVFDAAIRERILAQPVIDYVLKDNPGSVDYLVWLVERIRRNRSLRAVVIDDSRSYRGQIAGLLHLYGFSVCEAESAEAGLAMIEAVPHPDLVITDFALPGMDGVSLVRRIRHSYSRDRMAIIGISSSHSARGPISAQFIKSGANDYLNKPFLPEELFCRVAQNVESLESISAMRILATTDPLTGLRNRRSFFETAQRRFDAGGRESKPVAVAMVDIDHFKRINDSHGHDCGDVVLAELAGILADAAGEGDVVARFGGEEFCLLVPDLSFEEASEAFESLRHLVQEAEISFGGTRIPITISIGVCTTRLDSLGAMLTEADKALYRSKSDGRNRVSFSGAPSPGS